MRDMAGDSTRDAPRERLDALTTLRFFAAAMIVLVHSMFLFFPGVPWPPPSFVAAVTFFFILSGFILAHVYPSLAAVGTRRFLAARVARISPAHVLVLLLLLAMLPRSAWSEIAGVHHPAFGALLANILLIHAWIPRLAYNSGFNAVSWSISVEFAFYLCFPFLIRDWHRTWWWKLLGAFLLLCASVTVANRAPLAFEVRHNLAYFSPAARLFEFTLGMALAPLSRRLRTTLHKRPWRWTVAEVSAVAAVAIAVAEAQSWSIAIGHGLRIGAWGVAWLQTGGLCIPAMATLVLVISLQAGYVSRVLRWWPLVTLGEVSYAVYLLHQVLLRAYLLRLKPHVAASVPAWMLYVIFWVVVVVAAYVIWARWERPLRAMLVRVLTRRWHVKASQTAAKLKYD